MFEEQSRMGEFANGDVNLGQNVNNPSQDVSNSSNNDQQTVRSENSDAVVGSSAEGTQPAANNKRNEQDDDDNKKLFVGGLAHDITEEQLKSHFAQFGDVSNINIKSDLMTKKPRGFAFVSFTTCEAVTEALKPHSHCINGKPVDPKKAKARPKPPPMKKIFVGGLSPDISEQEVIKYFEQYGKVENVELPYDKVQSKRRAFCFVCFDTEKAALDAAAHPKQVIPPMSKQCDVKIATPPKPETYGFQPAFGVARGRDRYRGGFQNFSGFNYGGGYNPNFGSGHGGNFNQSYGGYNGGYGCNYDYNSGYSSGYGGGSNYDTGYWNYNQNSYGGGYGDSQCSDDYTRDTM